MDVGELDNYQMVNPQTGEAAPESKERDSVR